MTQTTLSLIVRNNKKRAQPHIDANNHNSDYWRGFQDAFQMMTNILENSVIVSQGRTVEMSKVIIHVDEEKVKI
jgi:hypothetical protein